MSTVSIRVRKIKFDEKVTATKPVQISVGTLPRQLSKLSPTQKQSQSLLTCSGLWTSHPVPGFDDKFLISMVRNDKILASVVIPLTWLPKDQVVTSWFPMKLQNHKTWKHAPMAHITFHYDTLGKRRFDAPKGELTILPGWNMSTKRNSNMNPQMIQQPIYPPIQQQLYQTNVPPHPYVYPNNFVQFQPQIPQYQPYIQPQVQQQPIQPQIPQPIQQFAQTQPKPQVQIKQQIPIENQIPQPKPNFPIKQKPVQHPQEQIQRAGPIPMPQQVYQMPINPNQQVQQTIPQVNYPTLPELSYPVL